MHVSHKNGSSLRITAMTENQRFKTENISYTSYKYKYNTTILY